MFGFCILASISAQAQMPKELAESIDAVQAKVIDWRHDFHQHPELSNREFRTAEKIAKHLKSLGLEVRTEVAKTGVIGLLH